MNDSELDRRVRDYFGARASHHAAPDFEAMLARAATRRRRVTPWLVPALAAAAVLGIVLLHDTQPSGGDPQAAAALVAELSTSTHWTAPSDRWLIRQRPPQFRALPDLDRMTIPIEGTKVWL